MTTQDNADRPRRFPVVRGLRIAGFALLGVAGAAVFALAFGWFVMLLWNWLMPAIFGLGTITYWQAFGIAILAKLLFGAIGGRGHNDHERWARRKRDRGSDWGPDSWRHWREFWNEEGREAFRRYVDRKSGQGPEPQSE